MIAKKELFESTPVPEAIWKLALPAVLGQIILVLYNMADTFFVGLTGSDAMLSAVTICMPAFMFLSAVANLFGIGGDTAAQIRWKGWWQRRRPAPPVPRAACVLISGQIPLSICWGARIRRYMRWPRNTCSAP